MQMHKHIHLYVVSVGNILYFLYQHQVNHIRAVLSTMLHEAHGHESISHTQLCDTQVHDSVHVSSRHSLNPWTILMLGCVSL